MWIEIGIDCNTSAPLSSLPSRECGLKLLFYGNILPSIKVTPFAGVWIEIVDKSAIKAICFVTPFAGVWIEILISKYFARSAKVTPFAGVWIEISSFLSIKRLILVTPFAGVWIEIFILLQVA